MFDANVYFMYCIRVEGNTHSLCPLDFTQKCCHNAGIMPFRDPNFQTFPGACPRTPLDERALRCVCPSPMFTSCARHCVRACWNIGLSIWAAYGWSSLFTWLDGTIMINQQRCSKHDRTCCQGMMK